MRRTAELIDALRVQSTLFAISEGGDIFWRQLLIRSDKLLNPRHAHVSLPLSLSVYRHTQTDVYVSGERIEGAGQLSSPQRSRVDSAHVEDPAKKKKKTER